VKTVSAGVATILAGDGVPVTLLAQLDLSQTLYLNASPITITYDGHDWLGAGSLGTVNEVSESAGEYTSLQFTLSGVPSDMLALALGEVVRNKPVTLSLAILDPATHAVEDVQVIWTGKLDTMTVRQAGGASVISVTAEPNAVEFARPKSFRYTDADQKSHVSGSDNSLRYIVSMAQHQDVWPAASYWKK
jgi:hypothetical protein